MEHKRTHPRLPSVSYAQRQAEVEGSRTDLTRICNGSVDVFAYLYGEFDQATLTNLISIVGTLCSTAATVIVLLMGGGVLGVVTVNLIMTIVMQIPSIWLIHRVVPELRFGWRGSNRQLLRTVLSFSLSLFIANVAGHLQAKTDEVVIGAYLPISAVSPYNFARRLSEIVQVLTEQFMKVILPLASTLHAENDQARLRSLYLVSTRLTLAIFLPLGCAMVILG